MIRTRASASNTFCFFRGEDVTEYKDQTDIFYASPLLYLKTRFPERVNPTFPPSSLPRSKPGTYSEEIYPWRHEWPQILVFFGALLDQPDVRNFLLDLGYEEAWRAEHGWEGDERRRGGVRAWRYRYHI